TEHRVALRVGTAARARRLLAAAAADAGAGRHAVLVRHAVRAAGLAILPATDRRAGHRHRPRAPARAVTGPRRRAHEARAALYRAHDPRVAAVARTRAGAVANARRPAARRSLGRGLIAGVGHRQSRQGASFGARVLAREAGRAAGLV